MCHSTFGRHPGGGRDPVDAKGGNLRNGYRAYRHSGEGRNPVDEVNLRNRCQMTQVGTKCQLDTALRRYDEWKE